MWGSVAGSAGECWEVRGSGVDAGDHGGVWECEGPCRGVGWLREYRACGGCVWESGSAGAGVRSAGVRGCGDAKVGASRWGAARGGDGSVANDCDGGLQAKSTQSCQKCLCVGGAENGEEWIGWQMQSERRSGRWMRVKEELERK